MDKRSIKVGIVGLGRMGRRWAKVVSSDTSVSLLGLADFNEELLKEQQSLYSASIATTRWETFLENEDLDAVVIATPHNTLTPIAKACLEAGKHVFCEKPGGLSSEALIEAAQMAQKQRKSFMVSFNHRFHPGLWEAKKLLDKGVVGKILFIRGRYGHGGRVGYEKEWRFQKKLSGGGELLDQGIHMIDLTRWFLGEIKTVQGLTTKGFWNQEIDENAFMILGNEKQQVAHLHVSYTQWDKLFSWEIYGEKGFLKVEGLGGQYGIETLKIGKRRDDFTVVEEEVVPFEENSRMDPDQSLRMSWKEFTQSVREKRKPVPEGYDAAKALEIVETVYATQHKE